MSTIINIGRSFGSGGGFVGHSVAAKLGIPFYDNDLISKVAQEKGYAPSIFQGGVRKPSIFSVYDSFEDVLFQAQSEVIRSIALSGDAVFIGRCAGYILRDLPCLNVFVTGSMEYRIARLVETEGLTEAEAEKLIGKKDHERASYYNYYTLGEWGSASCYHLCLDSSVLGIEGTADYIIEFGRKAGLIK